MFYFDANKGEDPDIVSTVGDKVEEGQALVKKYRSSADAQESLLLRIVR